MTTVLRVTHVGGPTVLPDVGTVLTTTSGARRLGGNALGLAAWEVTRLEHPDRPTIEVTATPCRHGPPGSHPIVGDMVGFALQWPGQQGGVLWISGDTVLYDGIREVAARLDVGTALLHLGGVRFPVSGPLRYTLRARDAATVCELLPRATVLPVHYEGWTHFREGRPAVERALERASADTRSRVRWLPLGEPAAIDA